MVPKPSPNSSRSPAPPKSSLARQEVESWIQSTCLAVTRGRKSSLQVGAWARAVGLGEVDWQLLWLLSGIPQQNAGRPVTAVESLEYASHQTELAAKLVVSPAQVSACVARLDAAGLILGHRPKNDRRRQLWRISDRGRSLVERVIALADERTALADERTALADEKRPGKTSASSSFPPAPSRGDASSPAA